MREPTWIGCDYLECTRTGARYESEVLRRLSDAGAPLYARYDLGRAGRALSRGDLAARAPDLWRYAELLPVRDPRHAIRLGEGMTPLLAAPRLADALRLDAELWIKDEGQNPTASFKARGLALAVSRASELGATAIALPSAGNAAGAAAAYAAAAGMPCHVVMPRDTPAPIIAECRALGANVQLIDGLITDCGAIVREGAERHGWFDVSTLMEPYRVEGKKTMGYELAEQLGWTLPDVIVYPTGGGTGLVGMWKAFEELEQLGWIGSARPRMVTVQATGCAPIVRAFAAGADVAEPWQGAATMASGLRVPSAIGDFLILRALRSSRGTAVAVSDGEMERETLRLGRTTGIFAAPEGAAAVAALPALVDGGIVRRGDRVVLFNTGSGLKYVR
jgi:threonine synthase